MRPRVSDIGTRRQEVARRTRTGLIPATVLAMLAAVLAVFSAGAPANAVQTTGDQVVAWVNGYNWTWATTFKYAQADGTNVTVNETVTYTVVGQETFEGQDAYKLNINGTINSGSGSAVVPGVGTASLSQFSGNVTGTRYVRRADLALLQENQYQHLNARATIGFIGTDIEADIELHLTPRNSTWRVHNFPLNNGDGWQTSTDVDYDGGFTYDAGSLGGTGGSDFDGTLDFDGPSNVTNNTVNVPIGSVATKRVYTQNADASMVNDSRWSAVHKNQAYEYLKLPLDDGSVELTRQLSAANASGGTQISATATPSYTCAGSSVTVAGNLSSGAAGQTITARLDQSQINAGQGASATAVTGANGAYAITLQAPSQADGLGRTGAFPGRASWSILLTGGGGIGAATVVVTDKNCSSLAYTGAIAGPQTGDATVSAQLTDHGGQGKAAGKTVTFSLSGGSSVNAITNASGVATATLPINGPVRSATVSATFAGTSDLEPASASSAFAVQAIPTATSVVANPGVQTIGDPITFTANVGPTFGASVPSGSVQFKVNGADFGGPVALSGGSATSAAISTLPLGFHQVVAVYLGSANHAGSSSPSVQFRVRNPLLGTTTTQTIAPTSSVAGQNVNLSATVTKASGSDPLTGNVTWTDGSTILGTAALDGSGNAELNLTDIPVGAHSIVATYSGDDVYAGSQSSPTGTVVAKADTLLDLQGSSTSTVTGEAVSYTATVAPVAPGAGVPTGTAQLVIDGNNVGAPVALVGGAAVFPAVDTLTAGTHTVAVNYSGDANFKTSSDSLTQSVAKADTTAVVVSGPSPQVEEEAVTITATVAAQAPGSGAPTGTVIFFAGTDEIGSASLSSGQATFTTSFLPVGTHQITAEYAGDANYHGSNASAVDQIIIAAAEIVETTTTVSSSKNPSTFGELVTFTAHVTAADDTVPAGAVQFSIDGTNIGAPVPVDANGNAESPTVSSPEPGDHLVIAAFASPAAYAASGDILTQQVDSASVTVDLTSSNANSNYGQAVSFHAAVSSNQIGTGTPGGFVQFRVDGVALGGAVALDSDGEATSPTTSTLAPGTHTVTAVYSGDAHFLGESRTITQNVGVIATTTSLTASTTSPTFGDNVTLTATVTPGSGALGAPTGTVTFLDGSTPLGTVPLAAVGGNGKATLSTSTLGGGAHPIKAVYNPTAAFGGSTSSVVTVNVAKKPTTLVAEAALIRLNPFLGINIGLLKATLTTASGPLAGQPVVFKIGNNTVCTSTTDGAGVAKCDAFAQLVQLTLAGGYSAAYAGTADYAASAASAGLIK